MKNILLALLIGFFAGLLPLGAYIFFQKSAASSAKEIRAQQYRDEDECSTLCHSMMEKTGMESCAKNPGNKLCTQFNEQCSQICLKKKAMGDQVPIAEIIQAKSQESFDDGYCQGFADHSIAADLELGKLCIESDNKSKMCTEFRAKTVAFCLDLKKKNKK
jgi:hypothetical protein